MDIIGLDFETYFDRTTYTLSNMTTESYVRDKRFEPHGCAIRRAEDNRAMWYHEPKYAFQHTDWSKTLVLAHHAHFDGLILTHHYGVRPAGYICTLSMGRGVLGNHLRLSLDSLARHFGLSPKSVPYDKFDGKHWQELPETIQDEIAEGCCHDIDLAFAIFKWLLAGYTSPTTRPMQAFPADELALISQTVRMFTDPRIAGDTEMLGQLWTYEENATRALLAQLGVTREDLRSDATFRQLLEAEGVEVAEKLTVKGNIKPAFAKTDDFMRELLECGNLSPDVDEWQPNLDRVQLLAQARVQAKSNLEQTRAERLGWMSTRGDMCVYINAYGAHTLRDSGGDKVNYQNLKRGSPLRRSLCAKKGQLIGTVDASQIECRFLNAIAGEETVIQAFRDTRDLYSELASKFYGFPVTKANPAERGTGKQLELSCGYGAGEYTIQVTAARGTYGPPVKLTLEESTRAKQLYRSTHPNVEGLWGDGSILLKRMHNFQPYDFPGPVQVLVDQANGLRRLVAPNGMHLIYDSLEWHVTEDGDKYWRVRTRRGYAKLYGAKVIENYIQWIARMHTMQCAVEIERETGLWPWLRNHDELAYVVPDDQHAEPTMEWVAQKMRTPPAWMPGIPLDAEYTLAERYEK